MNEAEKRMIHDKSIRIYLFYFLSSNFILFSCCIDIDRYMKCNIKEAES